MVSRHQTHLPKKGDKVYDCQRKAPAEQPNGFVRQIFYEDRQVEVRFYDTRIEHNDILYDFDDFRHNFSDDFGGIWYLNQ